MQKIYNTKTNLILLGTLFFLIFCFFWCHQIQPLAYTDIAIKNATQDIVAEISKNLNLPANTRIIIDHECDSEKIDGTNLSTEFVVGEDPPLDGNVIVQNNGEQNCRFLARRIQPNIILIKLQCPNDREMLCKGELMEETTTIVALRHIKSGQRLTSGLFKQEVAKQKINWDELSDNFTNNSQKSTPTQKIDYQNLKQYIATRDINSGKVLDNSDIELYKIISNGSIVTLRYHKNNLIIETPVKCLDNGKAGDIVRVRNLESNKVLRAIVIDEENVAIMNK